MWGIIPAAGSGSRIQPLAFSKELLPVGSRLDGDRERPRAVSEYLVDRMILAGAKRICFVISTGKSDILEYYGAGIGNTEFVYTVQQQPSGLCNAVFRALPLIGDHEQVLIGLPDTIWFPDDALTQLPDGRLSFLLFPVQRPELFDAVVTDETGRVKQIQVKHAQAESCWVWGAIKTTGSILRELQSLWLERGRTDQYIGTLVNAWMSRGGEALGLHAGRSYVDVGTLHGYREAIQLLSGRAPEPAPPLEPLGSAAPPER